MTTDLPLHPDHYERCESSDRGAENRYDSGRQDHPDVRTRAVDVLTPTAVVLLMFIGFFKGAPLLRGFPVDLTLASLGVVSIMLAGHHLVAQGRAHVSPWAILVLALAVPAAFYPASNPDVLDKRIKLLIPIVVVLGVCYLVRSRRKQQIWVWLHVAVGVALVATGLSVDDDSATRFTGAGSNTIGAGRASGVAIVVLLVLLLTGGLVKWWMKVGAIAIVGWLAIALISTGSRGPVFSCAAAVLLVATFALGRHRFIRGITAVGAVASGWLMLSEATGLGATRITTTLTGQYSLTDSRSDMWISAVQAIAHNPLGTGWGNFWAVLSPAERLDSGYDQYPHNFLLEVAVEAGWVAGLAVAIFVVMSLVRLYLASSSPYGSALLGIAIFFVLNALVSGDVNDNRMMWGALAIAWVSRPRPISSAGQPDGALTSSVRHQGRDRRKRLGAGIHRG